LQNDHNALKAEQAGYTPMPIICEVDNSIVQRNYLQIKQDVEDLVINEIERMMNDSVLSGLIVKKIK